MKGLCDVTIHTQKATVSVNDSNTGLCQYRVTTEEASVWFNSSTFITRQPAGTSDKHYHQHGGDRYRHLKRSEQRSRGKKVLDGRRGDRRQQASLNCTFNLRSQQWSLKKKVLDGRRRDHQQQASLNCTFILNANSRPRAVHKQICCSFCARNQRFSMSSGQWTGNDSRFISAIWIHASGSFT